MLINETKYVRKEGFVLRDIHEVYFLIDTKSNYYDDKCYLYEVNEIGAYLWDKLDTPRSITELATMLKEAINEDVSLDILYSDISDFIEMIYSEGFLTIVGEE